MANEDHLAKLRRGVKAWNQWREAYPNIKPDLRDAALDGRTLPGVNFARANLAGADLSRANLSQANLVWAILHHANLAWANLTEANLTHAHLLGATFVDANLARAKLTRAMIFDAFLSLANLAGAHLYQADLNRANLAHADLSRANLRRAKLYEAHLVGTKLEEANLTGCRVYGISAWNINLIGAQQSDLIITPRGEPRITVDNLEVAQFIYLLLHNEKIREVIDTITSKAVLILGRFTPERKAVLDGIRQALRERNLLPILFDFTVPARRTTLETVSTLAHMARFVIADLTDAKSVLQELQAIVPNNPSVPVQPILLASQEEPGMFDFFRCFPWVLESYRYHSLDEVLASLDHKVITPAEKAREQLGPMRR